MILFDQTGVDPQKGIIAKYFLQYNSSLDFSDLYEFNVPYYKVFFYPSIML